MKDQASRADEFRRLHVPGDPGVIFNAWDVGCACAIAVSIDREAGYGPRPEDVAHSVTISIRAGAIGINPEDGLADEHGIRDIAN